MEKLGWRDRRISPDSGSLFQTFLNFSSMDDIYPTSPIMKLRSSLSSLLLELQVSTNRVCEEKRTARLHASGLIIGIQGENADEQLQTARAALEVIEHKLIATEGDERKFYISRLKAWAHRLGVIIRQAEHKPKHQEAAALISHVDRRVKELDA